MKIYFAGSIRGGRQDAPLYAQIVKMLRDYGTVLTEHVADEIVQNPLIPEEIQGEERDKIIFQTDMAWMRSCDVVVAEVTQTSMGVGFELGTAWKLGKKVLCLYRPHSGTYLSAMVGGAVDGQKFQVIKYEEVSELVEVFKSNLS